MKVAALLLLALASLSVATIAGIQVAGFVDEELVPEIGLADADLVWCDANRALVGLAAETLGILPDEYADQPINVTSDDPDDDFADLADARAIDALRHLMGVAAEVPPAFFADIGYGTQAGFEEFSVLAPRSLGTVSRSVTAWVEDLDGGWGHPDATRVCIAAVEAFRSG